MLERPNTLCNMVQCRNLRTNGIQTNNHLLRKNHI